MKFQVVFTPSHSLNTVYEEHVILTDMKKFYNGCLWEIFFKVSLNFLSKGRLEKKFLIDNHYKTIFGSVRMAYSSYNVLHIS